MSDKSFLKFVILLFILRARSINVFIRPTLYCIDVKLVKLVRRPVYVDFLYVVVSKFRPSALDMDTSKNGSLLFSSSSHVNLMFGCWLLMYSKDSCTCSLCFYPLRVRAARLGSQRFPELRLPPLSLP